MPLDITAFRKYAGGDPDAVRESQRRRFAPVALVDDVISIDEKWRLMTGTIDNLKKKRNIIQKEVGDIKKKGTVDDNNETYVNLVADIKRIGEEIIEAERQQAEYKSQVDKILSKIGNLVDPTVPVSQDEDKDNLVLRRWGTPRDPVGLLNHHDLLWRIGGYEPDRGVNVAGHRGYFLKV